MSSLKLAIHFPRLGPYHIARITSAFAQLRNTYEVLAIEIAGNDSTYKWDRELSQSTWHRETLFPQGIYEDLPAHTLRRSIFQTLDAVRPSAIAICGYATADARAMLAWCKRNAAFALLMTETRYRDAPRNWLKEWYKSLIIRRFNSALCGGEEHAQYLVSLGLPRNRITTGYDVVDNQWFADNGVATNTNSPYFVSSCRFIKRKNLEFLVRGYSGYAKNHVEQSSIGSVWPLVLVGDGEERHNLASLCQELQLEVLQMDPRLPFDSQSLSLKAPTPRVLFAGFRQIQELPTIYANAGCFIHPAIEEPWGLVINEALACSTPVLASTGTGAAIELIQDGRNGWLFDPTDLQSIRALMIRIASLPADERAKMGKQGRIILEEICPLDAFGSGLSHLLSQFHK